MSAERSPDVRRSPPKNIFGGRPADPRGTGRSPRVSARIRAEPRRKVFRQANRPYLAEFMAVQMEVSSSPSEKIFNELKKQCGLWK